MLSVILKKRKRNYNSYHFKSNWYDNKNKWKSVKSFYKLLKTFLVIVLLLMVPLLPIEWLYQIFLIIFSQILSLIKLNLTFSQKHFLFTSAFFWLSEKQIKCLFPFTTDKAEIMNNIRSFDSPLNLRRHSAFAAMEPP